MDVAINVIRLGRAAAIALLISASAAQAARLTAISGGVLADSGNGFQLVAGSLELGAGATVMVNPDGRAELLYGDGCRVEVRPGDVVAVTDESPCSKGAVVRTMSGSGFFSDEYVVLGGVVVGGVIIGAVALSGGSGNSSGGSSPASP